MRGPKPTPVVVSDRLRGLLERLARRHTSPQRLVRRVRVVLAVGGERNNEGIARELGLDRNTVRLWRERWRAEAPRLLAAEATGEDDQRLSARLADALADAPRPGAPDTFTAEQVARIVALACEPPPAGERPVSPWTPRELADEAVKRGIVAAISPRTVGRFLGSGRPQAPPEPLLADRQAGRPGRLRRAGTGGL
jgi:putative transposase